MVPNSTIQRLENPDRFAIRLTEQISSIGLFAVTESQCIEGEHDDEDDSKFRRALSLLRACVRSKPGALLKILRIYSLDF